MIMKKKIITISGLPGSGKSSAAKTVAGVLNYKHFSSGDFMRNIALKRGISLNDLSKIAEKDGGKIDEEIDAEIRKTAEAENLVIDSRLAFHWIPESYKVFLDLPLEISKNRVWESLKNNPLRQQSEKASSPEEVLVKIKERLSSEHKRYHELYNINFSDKTNYDLVVDTDKNSIEETARIILDGYKEWLEENQN